MQIGDKELEGYMKIYEEEFGEKIDRKEAYSQFLRLVNVLRIVYYSDDPPEASLHKKF